MRVTYALLFDVALEGLLPEVGEWMRRHDVGGPCRLRMEFARLEIEDIGPTDEPRCRQLAEQAAGVLAVAAASRYGLKNWGQFGRVEVARVENAPNGSPGHNLNADNPAVRCPDCQQPMVTRMGKGGRPFWGCSQYPGCHGTRPMSA